MHPRPVLPTRPTVPQSHAVHQQRLREPRWLYEGFGLSAGPVVLRRSLLRPRPARVQARYGLPEQPGVQLRELSSPEPAAAMSRQRRLQRPGDLYRRRLPTGSRMSERLRLSVPRGLQRSAVRPALTRRRPRGGLGPQPFEGEPQHAGCRRNGSRLLGYEGRRLNGGRRGRNLVRAYRLRSLTYSSSYSFNVSTRCLSSLPTLK
jgi:hypothetical protein